MYKFKNIWLDPGHYAGANVDPRNPHYSEGDTMLKLGLRLKEAFAEKGIRINLTRENGRDVSFENRGKKAAGADLFISLHTDYPANDTLIFYPLSKPEDKAMAENIGQTVAKHLGVGFRGARTRAYPNAPNKDYYAVMRAALKYGAKHVFLLEHCGHAQMAVDTDNKIEKIVQAYLELFAGEQKRTPLISVPTATVEQAQEWARQNGAPQKFIDLAPLYWKIWPERAGLNPAIGYVQFAHETGWLYKNGSAAGIDASYHNPCGLKTTKGGGDYDPNAHMRFPDWETGITAHADHTALYAGADGYPRKDTPDPRHFAWIKGTAPYLEDLGGKWAPNPNYGLKLASMLKELESTEIKEEKNMPNQYVIAIQAALRDHGIDCGAVDGVAGPKTLAGVREAVNRMTLAEREWNKLKGTNTDARLEKAKTLAKQILEV